MLRVLVVDDEPLGRERILELLDRYNDVLVLGVASDGATAVHKIRALKPDLVFLDIQMPEQSGLDVVREIAPNGVPAVIFVTAYGEYAVEAFQLAAVDYLTKPFDDERFDTALKRARMHLELRVVGDLRDRLFEVFRETENVDPRPGVATGVPRPSVGAPPAPSPHPDYLRRIAVQKRGKTIVIPVESIDHMTANGVYVEVHVGEDSHLLRDTLQSIEAQLDPEKFLRIHRSEVVQIDRIRTLIYGGGGDYQVELRGGVKLPVGRTKLEEVKRRLGRR